ncbi:MAG: hypothetical protein HKL98_12550 [Burkholderiales bacterium]|nr:hypothetical protein [Burkholderiales bacterium]
MGRRHDLSTRLASLVEIGDIMTAMKNLAFMETRKLASFLSAQRIAVDAMENAIADFTSCYGRNPPAETREICLLIGSERSFCGDFNAQLARAGEEILPGIPVVAVGSRLANLAPDLLIPGANVAEEVEPVLAALVDALEKMQSAQGSALGITAIHHEEGSVKSRRLLPLPDLPSPGYSHPPLIHLEPFDLYEKLSGQYLYVALHEVLYSSLMEENRRRIDHMENAISRLKEKVERLRMRFNQMRQEEIIEEIEVIMLSVDPHASS